MLSYLAEKNLFHEKYVRFRLRYGRFPGAISRRFWVDCLRDFTRIHVL